MIVEERVSNERERERDRHKLDKDIYFLKMTFPEDKLLLRKAPGGTDASLRFAVHVRIGGYSQISIFQLFLINSQLVLRPISNYCCPVVSTCTVMYNNTYKE